MQTTRRALSTALIALSSLSALTLGATTAQAQPYTGQAYILRGNVGVNVGPGATPLVDVAVGAEVNRVNLPFPNGGAGNSANGAGNGLGVNIGTAVDLDVVTTNTAEITSAVTSNATITGANLLPNFSTLLPNSINLPGVALSANVLNVLTANATLGFGNIVGSLAQAQVIASTANDTPFIVANGTSSIVGLTSLSSVVNVQVDGSGNPLPNQRFPILVPINISTTVNGTVNVPVIGNVNVTNVALTGSAFAEIGEIIVNEQLPGGNPALITVNALRIKLYPEVDLPDVALNGTATVAGLGLLNVSTTATLPTTDILGEDLATTDLILSSSTAGALGGGGSASAPEPGTCALVGVVALAGVIARRRRAAK